MTKCFNSKQFIGTGGALIGNLLFGFLIDLNCVVPIVIFSSMLFSKFAIEF